ncbi:uncharacterized protein BXZ73DRAFT_3833, partial [Epithele typhae]|uniref:uncharacterized protein n=1 Tax=Epithele typhae TaxID=378194 RepID=UPI002008043B
PFDQPSVDLILRSSGHVYFHVHRAILTQASPVFADMFSIPQPSTAPQSDHPPVVDVSETEETLRCLLLLCYPLNKPHMESLQDVEPVLMAAIKYDMEWPLSFLSDRLQSAIADHPLRVWAIACRAGLAGIAQQAAATMKAPQASTETMTASIRTHLQAEGLGVLDRIGAGTYYRLREYLRSPSSSCVFTILPVPSTVPPPATVKSPSSTPSSLDITPSFITPDLPVDITLKCSDNVRVKTHKLMLVVHMPKNPHIVQVEDGGTVEIHFPSQTVVDLLRVCYLTEVGLPLTLDRIARALEASQSLGMDGVAAALHRRWKEKAASSPVAAFFAAAAHELDSDYIHDTARSTLRAKILGLYVKQMEDVAALVYHHLLQYHHDASLAVDGVLEKKQDAFRSDTF